MKKRPPGQLRLAVGLYLALGLALLVDWTVDDPSWRSATLYIGLGLVVLSIAMLFGKPSARIVAMAVTGLLLLVTTVVFALTVTGAGRLSAELTIAGQEFALSPRAVTWVSALSSALLGWLVWVLSRPSTKEHFHGE